MGVRARAREVVHVLLAAALRVLWALASVVLLVFAVGASAVALVLFAAQGQFVEGLHALRTEWRQLWREWRGVRARGAR